MVDFCIVTKKKKKNLIQINKLAGDGGSFPEVKYYRPVLHTLRKKRKKKNPDSLLGGETLSIAPF